MPVKDYRNSIEAWAKNKGLNQLVIMGKERQVRQQEEFKIQKNSKLNNETFRNYRRNQKR